MATGIRAGKAFIEMSLDSTKLQKDLRRVSRRLKGIGQSFAKAGAGLGAVGAAITGPALLAVKEFTKFGDTLDKMSKRTGVAASSLAELGFAAEQSGASLDTVEKALKGQARTLVNFEQLMDSSSDSVSNFFSSLDGIQGLAPEEQFFRIGAALADIENPTERAGLALQAFGRAGAELLPLFSGGASGIQALRKQFQSFGGSISQDDVAAAAELSDSFNILKRSVASVGFEVGASLAAPITKALDSISGLIAGVGRWVEANQALVRTVAFVGAAIAAAGAVIVSVGLAFTVASVAFGGFASALGVLSAIVTALLSPLGLLVAGVAALGVAVVNYFGAAGTVLDWMRDRFASLTEFVGTTVDAIGRLLSAGEIESAAKTLWASLKLLFLKGTQGLRESWLSWKNFFLKTWNEAVFGLAKTFVNGIAGVESAWAKTTDFLLDAWSVVTAGLSSTWQTVQRYIASGILYLASLWDDSFDLEGSLNELNKEFEKRQKDTNKNRDDAIGKRDVERQGQLAEIEARRQGQLGGLGEEQKRKRAELDLQGQQDIAQAQQDVDRARQEWKDAVEKADSVEVPERAGLDLKSLLTGAAEGLAAAGRGGSKAGAQFGGQNAALVFGTDQENVQKRQLKVQENMLEEQKRTRKAMERGGLTFQPG